MMPPLVMELRTESGRVVCEHCTVARTPWLRLRGLMGRSCLPEGEGLLLPRTGAIHMLFMRFPIDAVFLDRRNAVVRIAPGLRPWHIASGKGARAVVELPAGECERRGVTVGDRLALVAPDTVEDVRSDCLRVLVASRDPGFLRLAGATLWRAGHLVDTTTDQPERVERMIALRRPDVLVLEPRGPFGVTIRARIAALHLTLGVVLVGTSEGELSKWGPLEGLVDAVESAARRGAKVAPNGAVHQNQGWYGAQSSDRGRSSSDPRSAEACARRGRRLRSRG